MSEIKVAVSISPPPNVNRTALPYPIEQTYSFPIDNSRQNESTSSELLVKSPSASAPSPLCASLEATREGMNQILTKWKDVIGNEEKAKELEWEKNHIAMKQADEDSEDEDADI